MRITMKTPDYKVKTDEVRAMAGKIAEYRQAATLEVMQEVQVKMQQPGAAPTYPIQWDSERQRRAFFATNGFGGGIPHQRTGAYEDSWKIEPLANGVRLFSNSPATPFVGGNAFGLVRSGIHAGRWQLTQDALKDGFSKIGAAHLEATKRAIHDSHL